MQEAINLKWREAFRTSRSVNRSSLTEYFVSILSEDELRYMANEHRKGRNKLLIEHIYARLDALKEEVERMLT